MCYTNSTTLFSAAFLELNRSERILPKTTQQKQRVFTHYHRKDIPRLLSHLKPLACKFLLIIAFLQAFFPSISSVHLTVSSFRGWNAVCKYSTTLKKLTNISASTIPSITWLCWSLSRMIDSLHYVHRNIGQKRLFRCFSDSTFTQVYSYSYLTVPWAP